MNLPDFEFEKSLLPPNCRYLLGIDEVGRGPIAGPVTIGAFLLDLNSFDPEEFIRLGVRDSKLLSAQNRQRIHDYFLKSGHQFKTFSATSSEIDKRGIAVCIYSLMSRALEYYRSKYEFCLIDGKPIKNIIESRRKNSLPEQLGFVVKGDQKCFSIASASIVAKVDRDQQMEAYSLKYPDYGFEIHKGYGTKHHLDAIKKYGPCPIHRLSFAPLTKKL